MQRAELIKLRDSLAQELKEAEAALPAHSVRPQQWQRVEEAEERLAEVEARLALLDQSD